MKLPKIITAEWLTEQGACYRQVEKFRALFWDGAELTESNVAYALTNDLSVHWLLMFAPERTAKQQTGKRKVARAFALLDERIYNLRKQLAASMVRLFKPKRKAKRRAAR